MLKATKMNKDHLLINLYSLLIKYVLSSNIKKTKKPVFAEGQNNNVITQVRSKKYFLKL